MSNQPSSRSPEPAASSLPWVSTRQLGVLVLFVSITVLFAATVVAFLYTRANAEQFRAPGLPDLPRGLVGSTVLILLTSGAIWQAQRAIAQNLLDAVKRWLVIAAVLAATFLLTQAANWFAMRPPSSAPSLYIATFYILTGVHAAHIIGGFVPLGLVIHHAARRDYSSSHHEGLSLCAQYWHYLGAIWLVLVTVLYLGGAP